MSATTGSADAEFFQTLNGIPKVAIAPNLRAALAAGCRTSSLLRDIVALRRGPSKLTPQEYFYYRLWDPEISFAEKRRFVGKLAQHPMHVACNSHYWFSTAADKILFHTIMAGASLPVPELVAITAANRQLPGIPALPLPGDIAAFLRRPELYPLFIKPVAGKYSLALISADSYDSVTDDVVLLGGARRRPENIAAGVAGGAGHLIQRRLRPAAQLATAFGQRLWSVRVLALLGPNGPSVHRAVAKIATGHNPADNYWRLGNMLGAVGSDNGRIERVVSGTGAELVVDVATRTLARSWLARRSLTGSS